jgi:drug/metabolite transporter (DMT)-like permease
MGNDMKRFYSLIQKLKPRQTASIAAIVIGAILILFAKRSMGKAAKAKGTIDHVNDFFTNGNGMWNPLVKFFGGQVREEASKYDTTLAILLVIGIILLVLGIIGLFWHRRANK